jgi:hypothetical protein
MMGGRPVAIIMTIDQASEKVESIIAHYTDLRNGRMDESVVLVGPNGETPSEVPSVDPESSDEEIEQLMVPIPLRRTRTMENISSQLSGWKGRGRRPSFSDDMGPNYDEIGLDFLAARMLTGLEEDEGMIGRFGHLASFTPPRPTPVLIRRASDQRFGTLILQDDISTVFAGDGKLVVVHHEDGVDEEIAQMVRQVSEIPFPEVRGWMTAHSRAELSRFGSTRLSFMSYTTRCDVMLSSFIVAGGVALPTEAKQKMVSNVRALHAHGLVLGVATHKQIYAAFAVCDGLTEAKLFNWSRVRLAATEAEIAAEVVMLEKAMSHL